jgi:UDP-N-acetylglucosamine 2-epimerase (non-hydrolysing)
MAQGKDMKVAIVAGTRPDIIKLSPIIRYLEKIKANYFVIHTGQHYSYELDKVFFQELSIPTPKYNLEIKSIAPHLQGTHTGRILIDMEKIFLEEKPDIVLVHGDTNSALGGALLASKMSTTKEYTGYSIKIGHIESGLRSYDRSMPEEINRVICDHLSDYLFAPTESAKKNMLKEGLEEKKIFVVGNTIVDAVQQNLKLAEKKGDIPAQFGLKKGNYILATVHRQENVDAKEKFRDILDGMIKIRKELGLPIIYPLHPRTKSRMEAFGFEMPKEIMFIEPVGFLEFLQLEANAKLTMTDSGGVQEESCILNVPCVTIRENTERPETLEIGCNILAGTNPDKMLDCAKKMLNAKKGWKNPFGDGHSAEKISDILLQ